MGILTIGFVMADMTFMYGNGVINHTVLGSLVTILFYVLCVRGYEIINWIFIAIFLAYLAISILYKYLSDDDSECEDETSCGCKKNPSSCVND